MSHLPLDWLAILLAFIALHRLGGGHRDGFIAFMASNLAWLVFASSIGNAAIALGNLAFFLVNLRGFRRWTMQTSGAGGQ